MKKAFIKTKNVKNFVTLMENLKKCPANIPKMALVYGGHGLGKTQTILWWVTNNDAIYVRCNHKMTSRWLLSEIVKELDEEPCRQSSHLFRQIEDKLKADPRVIVVDEIDYLFTNTHTIETLRDIHDKLGVPILLVGMGLSNRKLLKYGHVNDRIFAILVSIHAPVKVRRMSDEFTLYEHVSIHAPVKVRRKDATNSWRLLRVSIHAPVKVRQCQS